MAVDDGETAPPPAKMRKAPYMPHELVSEILVRLPIESLLRFRGVCKAWRATISHDASFHRAHLRLQKQWLLLSPQTQYNDPYRLADDDEDKIGLYRWEPHQHGVTVPLLHLTDLSSDEPMHDLAHCDGLVLLPAEDAAVLVLNPATCRTLTLPRSRGAYWPHPHYTFPRVSHQAFGLGRYDRSSNMYKVACITDGYSTGIQVFTIGADKQWRETATHPPYPALPLRTATFFKGSLVWIIDKGKLHSAVAPGFLSFGLEDEDFRVCRVPPPPRQPRPEYTMSTLAELHGELCFTCYGVDNQSAEMWMCNNIKNPRWERRHTIVDSGIGSHALSLSN